MIFLGHGWSWVLARQRWMMLVLFSRFSWSTVRGEWLVAEDIVDSITKKEKYCWLQRLGVGVLGFLQNFVQLYSVQPTQPLRLHSQSASIRSLSWSAGPPGFSQPLVSHGHSSLSKNHNFFLAVSTAFFFFFYHPLHCYYSNPLLQKISNIHQKWK